MSSRDRNEVLHTDYTAAVPLEISSEVAERADDLLRGFAEEAGLSSALVVDRSGALVAGISSESEVTVEVISALVAGASGAMRALVSQLGETGNVESIHFGAGRLVYLREIVNRFILVGVSDGSRPAGLVRQRARMVQDGLSDLLKNLAPGLAANPRDSVLPGTRSLREVAKERAARRGTSGLVAELPAETVEKGETKVVAEPLEMTPPVDVIPREEEVPVEQEPREVLEPLDFGNPEIVIEASPNAAARRLAGKDLAVFSPFEEDEDMEEKDEIVDREISGPVSIFELEEDDEVEEEDEEIFSAVDADLPSVEVDSPMEWGGGLADGGDGIPLGNVFEVDEFDPELEEGPEDISGEINEMMDEEDLETEVRSSGPFYF